MQRKQDKDTLIRLQASSSAIERKARCNHQAASILKCHRKKSKMQSPGSKHLQVPWKEKQDAITRQQASSIAIERKTRCNCLLGIIFKIWKIQVEDAFAHS
ncbi:hypothetical protein [Blautia obeum]|uniref:hypothetical protein n=1 Tax=Blautia obeum TaxID=40520 RepID=UPI0006D77508|nr:hypothetical protein [Blautia obeum]